MKIKDNGNFFNIITAAIIGVVLILIFNASSVEDIIVSKNSLGTLKILSSYENSVVEDEIKDYAKSIDKKVEFVYMGDLDIVDELDRSLHTLISKEIVKAFLFGRDKDNKSQLILSTHDINLMDKKLFRLDEVWMCEKDYEGCSELISMYDYKNITKLPELKELYLKGKVGGIPIISDWF